MIQKQDDRDDAREITGVGKLIMAETLRSSAQSSADSGKEDKEDKGEHMSLFWRVFGGTILSISSLVVITLYNNLSTGISDLRADLNKERDAQANLIKKEDFNARSTAVFDRIRSLDALKPELEGLRERVAATSAAVDGMKKDTGTSVAGLKKDLTAMVEAMKKDLSGTSDQLKKDESQLVIFKERLAAMESVKKEV